MARTPAAAICCDVSEGGISLQFSTDPPWQFINKTGKVAPEHKLLALYGTMSSTRRAGPVRKCLARLRIFILCVPPPPPERLLPYGLW